jgi:predicted transcriptional regulator of viral defense system
MNKKLKQGYYTNAKLRNMGFNSLQIKKFADSGVLSKIKFGLYRTTDMHLNYQGFVDVCTGAPKAVISGFSALQYYNLTTFIPQSVYISIRREDSRPRIIYPPIEKNVVSDKFFNIGITSIKEGKYSFRIYDLEKSVCDAFRYKNKMGIDIAKEVLKEYIRRPDSSVNKLLQMAQKCKVKKIIQSWLTVLL